MDSDSLLPQERPSHEPGNTEPGQSRDLESFPLNAPDETQSSIQSDQVLIRRWLAEKSSRTQEEYARDIEQFIEYVDLPLRRITLGHLQSYREFLADQDYATSTQKRKLSAVKSLFTFGTKLRYFAHNVGAALSTPAVRNDRAERILSEANLWAILRDETNLRNHVLLRLFYASGGRLSDIEDLKWRDLKDRPDLQGPDGQPGGQVTFFGKGGKTRAVTLYSKIWTLSSASISKSRPKDTERPTIPSFGLRKAGHCQEHRSGAS